MNPTRAFSLMELVVALTIMVVLIPTAVPLYNQFLSDSKEEALRQRLREIRRAVAAFRMENGRYPNWLYDSYGNNVDFLDNQKSELVQGVHSGVGTYPAKRRIYLPEVPIDPTSEQKDWSLVIVSNENPTDQLSAGALRTGGYAHQPQLDSSGNPVLDQNGKPEYQWVPITGLAQGSIGRPTWKAPASAASPPTNNWTPPPQAVNPFTPRPVSVTGVGDVHSRTPGYQDY